ncbi:hypothetical protein Q8A73_014942 [Channa argus]|nr:hypothetical protein Q8A73_014942 [Channa argus]
MSDLCSGSSEEEQSEVEESSQEQKVTRLPVIQLMPRSKPGSPGGSPKISPKDSPRGSPRNSPMLFRKLLMNRSINLQRRRFTLAHTPRGDSVDVCCFKARVWSHRSQEKEEDRSLLWSADRDYMGRSLQGASDGIAPGVAWKTLSTAVPPWGQWMQAKASMLRTV